MVAHSDFEVVWPSSRRVGTDVDEVRPIGGLNGKRIALLWTNKFKGAEMFDILMAEAARRYPAVEFVGYDVFGDIHGPDEVTVIRELGDKLREHRIDGAIVGVGA
jgi:hypothetical protein